MVCRSSIYSLFTGGQGQYSAAVDKHPPQMPDQYRCPFLGLMIHGKDDPGEGLIRMVDKIQRPIKNGVKVHIASTEKRVVGC
jgi:hypothetical protein